MQGKIYWKLDVQNGSVREWSLVQKIRNIVDKEAC